SAKHADYSQSKGLNVSLQAGAEQQLLDGSFVFQLGLGAVIEGRVVDQSHAPVPGALVHVGMLSESSSRDARTATDGSFRVGGCPTGAQSVTASAVGFAPVATAANVGTNPGPLTLVLNPGRTLRVQAVDKYQRPIAGARLWLDVFSRKLSENA